jgi:DNA polymerase III subunit epsilon
MQIAQRWAFDDLSTPLSQVTFVVVDVETTGGSPSSSSLTEVAAARFRGGEMLGTYQTFVRPDERIPPFITALTGISDAMVADAPRVGEMLPSLLEFVGGAVLVGHNIRFDISFIDHALVSTGRDRLANATVDTLAMARRLVRDAVPDCKLGTLAANLRLPHQPSHRALTDVLATGDLLHAMLERAGSFGILELAELLDLPRLVGHPQAAKLRLTTRLPHRPGVYWFTDAAGHVLYVGRATDLQSRARSYFSGDKRPKISRLLRQLHAIHHRVCPDPLTSAVIEGRLIRAWSPPFNRHENPRRKSAVTTTRPVASPSSSAPPSAPSSAPSSAPASASALPSATKPGRRRRRVRALTIEELKGDPLELLAELGEELTALSRQQRYEEAASVRDEADRLRHLLAQHRQVESLRRAGRVVLLIDREVTVTIVDGVLVTGGLMPESEPAWEPTPEPAMGSGPGVAGRTSEQVIVAQWLNANALRVRILEIESPLGMAMPSDRIPRVSELFDKPPTAGPARPEPTELRALSEGHPDRAHSAA